MPDSLNPIVNRLLDMKAKAGEGFSVDRHPGLDAFIEAAFQYCEAKIPGATTPGDNAELNALSKKYIV